MVFDQLVPNKLWASAGVGVWNTTNLPTSNFLWNTPVIWNDQSIGIEQLVANEIIVPPGGNPVLASWDRPFFYISNANAYPSTYGPVMGDKLLRAGLSIMHRQIRAFSSGLLTGGALRSRATQPMAARAGLLSRASYRVPVAVSLAVRLQRARRQILFGRPQMVSNHITPSMAAQTWNPITLPGVSSWSGFDFAYYLDARTVTADRVLPNTFYLYYAGQGVFETTNGGSTWTKVFSGQISSGSNFNAELQSVPGEAGNLFFTGGQSERFSTGRRRLLSDQPMAEQHGQLFPTSLKSVVSVSARLRQVRATHRSTSSDTSTTSMASGSRSTTLNPGPR